MNGYKNSDLSLNDNYNTFKQTTEHAHSKIILNE